MVGVLGVAATTWAFGQASTFTQDRILPLFAQDRGSSINARTRVFGEATQQALNDPFGLGWAGLEPHMRPLAYPHNLLLESFAEGGWLFGGLLLAVVIKAFWGVLHSHEPVAAVTAALLMFSVFNAMVSGHINDNRIVFAILGLAIAVPRIIRMSGSQSRDGCVEVSPRVSGSTPSSVDTVKSRLVV